MSVELHHPDLPDQPIYTNDDAVSTHELSGWRRVEDAETSPAEPVNTEQDENGPLDLSEQSGDEHR